MEMDLQSPLQLETATQFGDKTKTIRYFDSRCIHIWIKQLSTLYHVTWHKWGGHGGYVISRRMTRIVLID